MDLEKTVKEYNARLEKVRKTVWANLLSRYGEDEVKSVIQEAKTACDRICAMPVFAVNRDGYELRLDGAKRLVQEAMPSLTVWEMWIPVAQKASLDGRVKELKTLSNSLEARRAEFVIAQRLEEEESRRGGPEMTVQAPQPILIIKPTSLSKFTGIKRDFYQWKRD